MEYKIFGKTGFKVSSIGMGTYYDFSYIIVSRIFGIKMHKERSIAALRLGLENGINLIDTAEIYETEPLVAEAIKGYKRDEIFIATKVWPTHLRYNNVIKACENSLKRLQINYIDLYQIHWYNPRAPLEETMKAMEYLVDVGKIRYIGISNFNLEQTIRAQNSLKKYELVSTQMRYNLLERNIEKDILPYCIKNNIAILAYYPLAHGKLSKLSPNYENIFKEIQKKYGNKTPAQIALNWLLSKHDIVFPIPRASNPVHVKENLEAVGWRLSKEDLVLLDEIKF
jgi:diketogulonate reductase-like aldo/keto reductase